jgi:hypothetical protein
LQQFARSFDSFGRRFNPLPIKLILRHSLDVEVGHGLTGSHALAVSNTVGRASYTAPLIRAATLAFQSGIRQTHGTSGGKLRLIRITSQPVRSRNSDACPVSAV